MAVLSMPKRLFSPHVIALYLSLCLSSVTAAPNIDDLFNVKAGTTNGGCDNRKTTLQSWLTDTATLVSAGLTASDSGHVVDDAFAQRNLYSFFGVEFDGSNPNTQDPGKPVLDGTIHTFFSDLNDFLNGNGNNNKVSALQGDNKPWLFCDSTWLVETEIVYDNDGDVVSEPQIDDENPTIRNIPLDEPGGEGLDEYQTPAGNTDPDNWDAYAYWSSDIKDYYLVTKDKRYLPDPNSNNARSWCAGDATDGETWWADNGNDDHRYAVTQKDMDRASITLCPDAFTNNAASFETIADVTASQYSNQVQQLLDEQMPRLVTFMHEMFHLIEGHDATPDVATKATACLELASNGDWQGASKNPETYPFFSLSYWLTNYRLGDATSNDGNAEPPHIDWSTGVSQFWEDSASPE